MSRTRLLLTAVLIPLLQGSALAQGNPATGVRSTQHDVLPLSDIATVSVDAPDLEAVEREDAVREELGQAPRFAIPHAVRITPSTHGTWEDLDAETVLWRLRIQAPGAANLNLGFERYSMPPGGELWIYSADLGHVVRPFTARDNEDHGELWTPIVSADDLVVELVLPLSEADQLELVLKQIAWGYRGFGDVVKPTSVQMLSGSCNVDVVCPQGDLWRMEIPSVGVISTGGGTFCSGFMVNNVRQDQVPYFMTARHCGIGAGNAASLVVYWNYENSSCRTVGSPQNGQPGNGSYSQFNSGSYWRAGYSPSDFTLVELDDDPDPGFNLSWAGWDATGVDASSAVGIHHPQTQEKRISFENEATTTTSYLGSAVPGNGTHARVIDWDVGTTEGGSSGSPLFNQDHQVIGQLHGGYASCSSQTSDWYGKFSVSFVGGGTSSTALKSWLDPDNTGTLKVNTLSSNCSGVVLRYCTAGTSASGCQPQVEGIGLASATAPSGFVVTASRVEGKVTGQFFFGTNGRQANPWGSGTSFKCVVPPTERVGVLSSGGTNGACDGTFSQDLNTRWTANPKLNPGEGSTVQLQLWYRDRNNTSNQTTSLTDAIEFVVCP